MGSFRHVALGIGMAASTAAAADAPLAIGLRFAPGQTLTYRIVETVKTLRDAAAPAGVTLPTEVRTGTVTLRVARAQPDGSSRVEAVGRRVAAVFTNDGAIREVQGLEEDDSDDAALLAAALQSAYVLVPTAYATAGATWSGMTRWRDDRAGEVSLDHHVRLEGTETGADGMQARLTATVEGHKDALGKIPRDRSREDFEWAVETLTGTAEMVYDVALGQPRRATSRLRTSFVNRPRRGLVGGFPDYERIVREEETTVTLELLDSRGPRPAVPAAVAPAADVVLPAFADFSRRADEECFVAPDDDTNVSQRGAAAAEARCLQRRSVAALDRVLVPLKAADPTAFRALMAEQAAWNRYVERACWLAEEKTWVIFASRARGDGTMRGYANIGCARDAALSRGYYAEARRRADPRAFARHVQDRTPGGTEARAFLQGVRKTLTGRPPASEPEPGTHPLEPAAVQKLVETAQALEASARELGRATCEGWPGLAEALGGADRCRAQAEGYYLSYAPSKEGP